MGRRPTRLAARAVLQSMLPPVRFRLPLFTDEPPMPEVYERDRAELDLTVLLPSFNEEEAIGPVIEEIRTALKNWPGTYEILIVDDASTDRTAERAVANGVRVLRRPENGGSGASRKTGT